MARNDDGNTAKKMDVILGGMETIGSAERSCDVDMMRDTFHQYYRWSILKTIVRTVWQRTCRSRTRKVFRV